MWSEVINEKKGVSKNNNRDEVAVVQVDCMLVVSDGTVFAVLDEVRKLGGFKRLKVKNTIWNLDFLFHENKKKILVKIGRINQIFKMSAN